MADNNTLYREDGINKNTFKLLFSDDELGENQSTTKEMLIIRNTICEYTIWHEKIAFYKVLKFFFKNEYVDLKSIKYDSKTKEYKYVHNNEEYTFDILSKYIEGITQKNFLAQLISNHKVNKELHSKARYGRCHHNSLLLAEQLKDSKILTGYATFGIKKILHSVVVKTNKQGIPTVYDWTQNLIMPLDDYKRLVNFVEVSEVDREDMLNDLSLIIGTDIVDKVYLTFRDEIISDMHRNEEIFNRKSK